MLINLNDFLNVNMFNMSLGKLITQLQDEVNKLILRVKQLTILLKQASIPIPLGPSIKPLGKKRHKWSNKLSPPDNLENSTIPSSIAANNAKGISKITH